MESLCKLCPHNCSQRSAVKIQEVFPIEDDTAMSFFQQHQGQQAARHSFWVRQTACTSNCPSQFTCLPGPKNSFYQYFDSRRFNSVYSFDISGEYSTYDRARRIGAHRRRRLKNRTLKEFNFTGTKSGPSPFRVTSPFRVGTTLGLCGWHDTWLVSTHNLHS
jgi:hypothetical protein